MNISPAYDLLDAALGGDPVQDALDVRRARHAAIMGSVDLRELVLRDISRFSSA